MTAPRTLTAHSPALPEQDGHPVLTPVRLQGEEALAELFTYHLELKTPDDLAFSPSQAANFDLPAMAGRAITVSIELDGRGHFTSGAAGSSGAANQGKGVREISALITEAAYLRPEGRHHVYGLTLRPWLWLATLNQECRIFQDQSVVDTLNAVLGGYPFPVEWRLEPGKYPVREFQVQFNEPDYTFFARLCEEWGIVWWFEHSEGAHRLVLADGPGAFRGNPSEAYREVAFYPPGHKPDEEYVHALAATERVTTGAWASSDADYTRARAELGVGYRDVGPTGHAQAEVFHWPVDASQPLAGAQGVEGEANDPWAEGEAFARVRLEALRSRGRRAQAKGNLRGMVTGCTFSLARHPQAEANIEWLILGSRLEIEEVAEESQGSALDAAGNVLPPQAWRCAVELSLQPSTVVYRPPQRIVKPRIHGIQRAKVTGPAGKEIWTDVFGRVKVAFPWDRYHANDEQSSCWLRVSSPWAGVQFGGIQIPRIGQEVLVSFEEGDPDRPLITGRVVNNVNPSPWALPQNQALSGFRSKELYGGLYNHLILDDSTGEVQAQLSSDYALSQLNLGKVVRVPDNGGRSDKRGEGFELRTDAHGVIRAAKGLLLTTESRANAAAHVKSMEETQARLRAAESAHGSLADLAVQHGAQESDLQPEVAKRIGEQNKALEGQGKKDVEAGGFPEMGEPLLALSSPAGVVSTTPGSTHFACGEDFAITTGGSTAVAAGGSLLASVSKGVRLFTHSLGIKLVAAANDIEIKALSNNIHLIAKLKITQTAETIDIAAKTELLINGGGSYTRFTAGNIEHGTPGAHTTYCASRDLPGPLSKPVPPLPKPPAPLKGQVIFSLSHLPDTTTGLYAKHPYTLLKNGAEVAKGVADDWGRITIKDAAPGDRYDVKLPNGTIFHVPVVEELSREAADHLAHKGLRADGKGSAGRVAQHRRGNPSGGKS